MKRTMLAVAGLMVGLSLSTSQVFAQNTKDAKDAKGTGGKKMKIEYTLTVDGKQVETNVGKEPLAFTLGEGKIIPGLEKALTPMKVGEKKSVTIAPEEAYGPVVKEAYREIPKTSFPKDFTPKVDLMIEMQDQQGNVFPGTITEIKDQTVTVNFNHPLAGKTLTFDVKVISVE